MRMSSAVSFILLALLAVDLASAAETRRTGLTFEARYEGGTLPVSQRRIKAAVAEDEVVFLQGNQRFSVPIRNITAISCGTDVRRRMGAAVLGVVPRMHLDTTEQHYIGLTWTSNAAAGEKTSRVDAVLKFSHGDYRDFLSLLERLTGRKAVDAGKVSTVVRYEL